MMTPRVERAQAAGFAAVWRHNGVAIPMLDVHMQFAADFATVVLKSYVENAMRQAAAAAKARQIVTDGTAST